MNPKTLTAAAKDLIARHTPTVGTSGALYPSGDRLPVNQGGYQSRDARRQGVWFEAVAR